jgi:hypothetical protein
MLNPKLAFLLLRQLQQRNQGIHTSLLNQSTIAPTVEDCITLKAINRNKMKENDKTFLGGSLPNDRNERA